MIVTPHVSHPGLEDHVAKAKSPDECVCPMCRAKLIGDQSGKVDARAATLIRANMKKIRGKCHCGQAFPLSAIRSHLRTCGPEAHLYPPKRKFGHEFKQPDFVLNKQTPSRQARHIAISDEEERAMLQAAIAASLATA